MDLHWLIQLVVVLVVMGIVWWAITQIPLPAPASWIVRVLFGLICALIVLNLLVPGLGWHTRP